MSDKEIFRQLRAARQSGADGFWFGGGEPTTRPDFLKVVRAAKKLGFKKVKIQTNAMMCASEDNLDRMIRAGVTEFNVSIKGHNSDIHDALTQTEGCFDLLCEATRLMKAKNVPVHGDILLYEENTPYLKEIIQHFEGLGVVHFNLWHLSLYGADEAQTRDLSQRVPRMAHVAENLVGLGDTTWKNTEPTVTALHLPPCSLPSSHWHMLFQAATLGLVVADPGGHTFRLEQSPFEGGVYLPRCESCAARDICDGLRDDYLKIFGDDEFQAISGQPVVEIPPKPLLDAQE